MSDSLIDLRAAAERVIRRHPMQYGYKGRLVILHTENVEDPTITDRMNRCPECEEWSPCDVRSIAQAVLDA